ncbi:MAG: sensor domain-containing diguanylate cyclase [Nitrospirae bacterium]|nr:sensor domain-containing diguanylate cyclase [Nitrospirota bacterium]
MTASLRTRLSAIFLGATLLTVIVVGSMMLVVRDLAETVHTMEGLAVRMALTDQLQLELSRVLMPLNDYLLTVDVKQRDAFDQSITKISKLLADLDHGGAGAQWHANMREINDRVIQLGTIAVEVLFVERPVGNPEVPRLMNDVNRLSDEIIDIASRFHRLAVNDMAVHERAAAEKSAQVNHLLIGLFVVVPLFLVVFYALLARWVTKPLLALHRGVRDLSTGRTVRLAIQAEDEIGEVGQAFNDLVAHLRDSQEQVQRYTRQHEALYTASRALSKESSRDGLYQTLTDSARKATDSQYAALVLFDEEIQIVQVVESGISPFGSRSEAGFRDVLVALPPAPHSVRVDGSADPRFHGLSCDPPLTTLLAVPVFAEANRQAQLYVMGAAHGVFTSADEDLVVTIARDAAQSLKVIRLHEEAERLATIDGLTGFANRGAFEERLAEEFLKAGRHSRPFALVFSDLDHLKELNDRFGHAMGDAAIRRFSDAIRASIRTTDIVGRYGGDEILVLMPETTLEDALTVADRILRQVAALPLVVDAQAIPLTVSLGVAAYPQHGHDKDALLNAADHALYQAKAQGRSRVHIFTPVAETGSPSAL